jgi:hypothetical protein
MSVTAQELDILDTMLDECKSQNFGGGVYLVCKVVFLRCCGRFCTAWRGTLLHIQQSATGPQELNKSTVYCCGDLTSLTATAGDQTGGIYVDAGVTPQFDHFNISSNRLKQDANSVPQGRGAAIYGLYSRTGFDCTFLTLYNNTGNTITDCGSVADARLTFANIVLNKGSSGLGIVYADNYGMILTNCVFLRNTGAWDLYRSGGTGYVPFRLAHCFFDWPPLTDHYSVITDVVTSTTAPTHVIPHLDTAGCRAEIPFASDIWSQSSLLTPSRAIVSSFPLLGTLLGGTRDASQTRKFEVTSEWTRSGLAFNVTAGFPATQTAAATHSAFSTDSFRASLSRTKSSSVAVSKGFRASTSLVASLVFSVSVSEKAPLDTDSGVPGLITSFSRWLSTTQQLSERLEAKDELEAPPFVSESGTAKQSGLGRGVIGAIVGSLLFLLLVAGLLIFFLFCRQSEESKKESTSVSEVTPPLPDSELGNSRIDDHEFVNVLSADVPDGIQTFETDLWTGDGG